MADRTQTAVAHRQETPQEARTGGAVAVIQPPRLPYHPQIEERFGIDRAAWRALTDAVFPAAKSSDSIILALSYCKARKLDPFKRVVHIVPIWDNERRGYVETVWPGIAEHRTTAFRTKQYAGAEAAAFGDTVTKEFTGQSGKGTALKATVTFPMWCQLTVYRMIDGQRVPVPGPRVYWLETYSKLGRADVPNDRWQRAPFQMIEKCAEAAALRRAFPEELGDEATSDEAGSRALGSADAKVIDADEIPPRPRRADFQQNGADRELDEMEERGELGNDAALTVMDGEVVDQSTGEVTEGAAEHREPSQSETARDKPAIDTGADIFWTGTLEVKPEPRGKTGDFYFGKWEQEIARRIKEAATEAALDDLLKANARHLGTHKLKRASDAADIAEAITNKRNSFAPTEG